MPSFRHSRLAVFLICSAFTLVTGKANANTIPHDLSVSNFSQNWSNTNQITAADDWSGVPSIMGYRGDGLVSGTGVDPRTVTGTGTPVIDVNEGQTNPNTFTTGGVTEFEISDPVVALAGSSTAKAPHLSIYLNTTGRQNIAISYKLRDLENGADDAIQQIALQYRVGSSGNLINVTNGTNTYVADATVPNATQVTQVNAILPSAANNQGVVELRVITTDAASADEWVGIDDINISSDPTTAIPYPTVPAGTPATAIISEYRPGTTASSTDEYIEIYNASGTDLNLNGYKVVAGTSNPGITVHTFSASTIIPSRGHYLLGGDTYSLATARDASFTNDLPSTGGVALLNPAGQIVDQVGVAGYVEGTGVASAPSGVEYAYVRKVLPGGTGEPSDTGNNATDFFLVSTTSTSGTGSPRLGSPGPENLASPIQGNGSLGYTTVTQARVTTPSANAPAGTLTLRRRITNNTRSTITLIRLRAVEITAGTGGTANTPIISGNGSTAPGVALPQGGNAPSAPSNRFVSMTLEGPSATSGAGVNASLTSGPISLPVGESIDIEYTLNIVTGGTYRVVASFEYTLAASTTPTPTPTTNPTPDPTATPLPDDDNMLLGNPSAAVAGTTTEGSVDENNRLVRRPSSPTTGDYNEYALGYSRNLGGPKWVSWHLKTADTGGSGRNEAFRADPLLPPLSQVTESDYSNSGYSRGHQCPSGDRTFNVDANENTFYMSNMLPQTSALNSGTWATLEDYARSQTESGANEAYIICGGIYGANPSTIAGGKIKVPTACWKVVIILPTGTNDISRITANTRIIAIIAPNNSSVSGNWAGYTTTVDNIESQTGLDLLSNLPDAVENALEAKIGSG